MCWACLHFFYFVRKWAFCLKLRPNTCTWHCWNTFMPAAAPVVNPVSATEDTLNYPFFTFSDGVARCCRQPIISWQCFQLDVVLTAFVLRILRLQTCRNGRRSQLASFPFSRPYRSSAEHILHQNQSFKAQVVHLSKKSESKERNYSTVMTSNRGIGLSSGTISNHG